MRRLIASCVLAIGLLSAWAPDAHSHCQIPCGIYDDDTRFTLMREHVTTIEKSINQITELSKEGTNQNQIVRWVMNKESHADQLTEIVTAYFLAQRIKPVDAGDKSAFNDYTNKLRLLHQTMVHAMQAKQTTDLSHVASLRSLIDEFETAYAHKH